MESLQKPVLASHEGSRPVVIICAAMSYNITMHNVSRGYSLYSGSKASGLKAKREFNQFRIALAGLIMFIVPAVGFAIRSNSIVVNTEIPIFRMMMRAPQWVHTLSAGIAVSFSTIGCIIVLVIGACVDAVLVRAKLRTQVSASGMHSEDSNTVHTYHMQIMRVVLRDVLIAIVPMAYIMAVKWIVMRPRPITAMGSAYLPKDPSFPSGHTSVAVCVAIMLVLIAGHLTQYRHMQCHAAIEQQEQYVLSAVHKFSAEHKSQRIYLPWLLRGVGVAIVLIVAYSRMVLGVHYPTDVFAAAVAYIAVAILVHTLLPRKEECDTVCVD